MRLLEKHIFIGGMTCVNCQKKIHRALARLPGMQEVSVSYRSGTVRMTYDADLLSFRKIRQTIEALDYQVLPDAARPDVSRVVGLLAIIIALYVLLQQFGLLNLLVPSRLADSGMGYGMLFVVGLLTSVHCIAMCGGIHLSQCLPQGSEKETTASPLLPSILYNLGRALSYTIVGFLLGGIGMLLGGGSGAGIPVLLQGVLKLIAGAVMVIMGVNMLGLFPWLRRMTPRMPEFLSKRINRKKAVERRPFFVGLLNGLMPCGPLQSMQILALASGNPFTGALSMLLFSLGTIPLMLGLGTIVSTLGKKFAHTVTQVGAVLVAVLGIAMLSQGGSLSGMLTPEQLLLIVIGLSVIGIAASVPVTRRSYRVTCVALACVTVVSAGFLWNRLNRVETAPEASEVRIVNGVQIVDRTLSSGQYPTISVQAGLPVRWTIHASEDSINGCNYRMLIREYGIEHSFEEGENIITFTPTDTGRISYTCWMGMIRGDIIVTESEE